MSGAFSFRQLSVLPNTTDISPPSGPSFRTFSSGPSRFTIQITQLTRLLRCKYFIHPRIHRLDQWPLEPDKMVLNSNSSVRFSRVKFNIPSHDGSTKFSILFFPSGSCVQVSVPCIATLQTLILASGCIFLLFVRNNSIGLFILCRTQTL